MPTDRVPEAVLSRIWNDGWHSRELRTVDGRRVGVVYRGVWTHSNGPDFRDAMLEIDGRLVQGSVELHVKASDWMAHGHHLDPAYDAVVLHVVLENDLDCACHGPSETQLPTIEIQPFLSGSIEEFLAGVVLSDLGDLGRRACLPTLAGERPDEVRAALRRKGWQRLTEKQLTFQQDLEALPSAEVLYRGLLDSLGLSGNRGGMRALARALPLTLIERIAGERGLAGSSAAVLGVGGFLPVSPAHQAALDEQGIFAASVEQHWNELAAAYGLSPLAPTVWNLNRVRPLNHPARRLASMAWLLADAADDGLLVTVLGQPLDDGSNWDRWLAASRPAIGESRRRQIIVNTLAPFVAAYAEVTEDRGLLEQIGLTWEKLAGRVDDDVARKTLKQITGARRFAVRTALEVQGLHQIGRFGCAHLRCFECPIAALAVQFEATQIVS